MRNTQFILKTSNKSWDFKPKICGGCSKRMLVPIGNRTTVLCEICHDKTLLRTHIYKTIGLFEMYLDLKEQGFKVDLEELLDIYALGSITTSLKNIEAGFIRKPFWLDKPYATEFIVSGGLNEVLKEYG